MYWRAAVNESQSTAGAYGAPRWWFRSAWRSRGKRITSGVFIMVLAVGGCTSLPKREPVLTAESFEVREVDARLRLQTSTREHEVASAQAMALLAEPLTADGAVRLALEFSPGVQRLLAERDLALATATQSARLPNPVLAYGRLRAGDVAEIDRALRLSLLDVLLWPQRRRLAASDRTQVRMRSAADVLRVAAATRRAWVEAITAKQSEKYAEQVRQSAAWGAELARRMLAAGNFSRVEQAEEDLYSLEAANELARGRLEAQRTREVLTRLMGLPGDMAAQLQLPNGLPDLPAAAEEASILPGRTISERIDVSLARAQLDYAARSLGLTRVIGTVGALEVAGTSNSVPEGGGKALKGYEIDVQLPLFDFGDARRAGARAAYLAALNRSASVIASAESSLRETYQAYRIALEIARRYRDEIVPVRQAISEENQLRYNGMLISVFDLLADARARVSSVRQAIAAQRDFWLADAALRLELIGGGSVWGVDEWSRSAAAADGVNR